MNGEADMAQSDQLLASPTLDLRRTAFFLDFDGVLAPIAPTPDEARMADETRAALRALARRCGGAVAIVSGRALIGSETASTEVAARLKKFLSANR